MRFSLAVSTALSQVYTGTRELTFEKDTFAVKVRGRWQREVKDAVEDELQNLMRVASETVPPPQNKETSVFSEKHGNTRNKETNEYLQWHFQIQLGLWRSLVRRTKPRLKQGKLTQ